MTMQEAYRWGQKTLKEAEISDWEKDAWYLLEFVTEKSRADFFLHREEQLSAKQEELYRLAVERRASHIPLQHITGVSEFMGLSFVVTEDVLVPRQDTEVLVEMVLGDLKPGMKVLDMCTGSGCILISLLKLSGRADGNIEGLGVDISERALLVAEENLRRHGMNAQLIKSDLFEEVDGLFHVIVSNPPYIPTGEIAALSEEVRLYDPLLALDGREDGLFFYRRIIKESPAHLYQGGRLYFEIGHDQGEAVKELMEEAGFSGVTIKKDLAGLDRVVLGTYNDEWKK